MDGLPFSDERLFGPDQIAIMSSAHNDLIIARCLVPSCKWRMTFSTGAQRLGTIYQICMEHPHKPESGPEFERLVVSAVKSAREKGLL